MDVELIIKIIMGLVVVLVILVFILSMETNKKPEKSLSNIEDTVEIHVTKEKMDLDSLVKKLKNKKATSGELAITLNLIIKKHGKIQKKLGSRTHPDFDIYMDILFTIIRHPNTNKDLILNFDRELENINPEYKKEINEAITKGLNSRSV